MNGCLSTTAFRRAPGRPGGRLAASALLVVALVTPPLAVAAPTSEGPVPIGQAELANVTGGCLYSCTGSSGSSGSTSTSPTKVGSPYWEFSHRSLISRPAVAGDLVWHRVNRTAEHWGPFDVSYRYQKTFNWSLSGSVPHSYVQAHIGGAYETTKTMVERFTIPPWTYYKFFVAYPYERWRYYYRKYQDYSDNSREVVASGDAAVYDQWTKSTLVSGPAY